MNKMMLITLSPLIALSALGAMYSVISIRARMNNKADPRGATIIYIFLFFTFLILVQCSSTVFDFFQCKTFPEALNERGKIEEKRYLNRDYSVDCNSARYNWFVPYGLIMIAVRNELLSFFTYSDLLFICLVDISGWNPVNVLYSCNEVQPYPLG